MGRKWMVMLVRPITHLHADYIHIHRCVDNSLDGWSHTESEIKKEEEEKTLKHPKSNWLNFMEPCHCFLLCVARICLFRVVIFLRLLRLCLNSNKNTLVFYMYIHQLQINCFSTFFASTVLVCVSVCMNYDITSIDQSGRCVKIWRITPVLFNWQIVSLPLNWLTDEIYTLLDIVSLFLIVAIVLLLRPFLFLPQFPVHISHSYNGWNWANASMWLMIDDVLIFCSFAHTRLAFGVRIIGYSFVVYWVVFHNIGPIYLCLKAFQERQKIATSIGMYAIETVWRYTG